MDFPRVLNRRRGIDMKRHVLSGIALSVLIAGPATAADMAVKALAYKAAPIAVPSWTGFYFGVHGGCGRSDSPTPSNYQVDTAEDLGAFTSSEGRGCFGGGQVGYNYQFSNNIIIGIKVDAAAAIVKSDFETLHDNRHGAG